MVYVLDRSSGEILSAHPFVDVNATKGVDHGSGTLRRNPDKAIRVNSTTRDICPAWPGATGGTAQAAFSPQTGLLYIPASRLCMDMEARQTSFMPVSRGQCSGHHRAHRHELCRHACAVDRRR